MARRKTRRNTTFARGHYHDVMCRAFKCKRAATIKSVWRQCAPGTLLTRLDPRQTGRTCRDQHEKPSKGRGRRVEHPVHNNRANSTGLEMCLEKADAVRGISQIYFFTRGERRNPFCSHSCQTSQKASLTMPPAILDWPCVRSVKMIGTSATLNPCRQSLLVSSIWKP